MKKTSRLFFMFAVLVMGLCFHASFAQAGANTPESVAKNFAKAYFMMDPSMADYLSEDALFNEDSFNTVELFLLNRAEEAGKTGYSLDFYKMKTLLMKTKILSEDETSATVELQAVIIRSINPLYRIVGYLFGLLETQEVRSEIRLVKEDETWKIEPDWPLEYL
jgi:hypothetical protein